MNRNVTSLVNLSEILLEVLIRRLLTKLARRVVTRLMLLIWRPVSIVSVMIRSPVARSLRRQVTRSSRY